MMLLNLRAESHLEHSFGKDDSSHLVLRDEFLDILAWHETAEADNEKLFYA